MTPDLSRRFSLNICHAPLFFWFMNECCPVGFKGKNTLFELPKHWIVLVLYIFILILFYFFVPWTLIGKSLLKEASSGKSNILQRFFILRINILAIKDKILTQNVDSVALEKHFGG